MRELNLDFEQSHSTLALMLTISFEMKENEDNSVVRKRNDSSSMTNQLSSKSNKWNDNDFTPQIQPWTFGRFTFLNFISALAIVLGIGSAVFLSKAYIDQRETVVQNKLTNVESINMPSITESPMFETDVQDNSKLDSVSPTMSPQHYVNDERLFETPQNTEPALHPVDIPEGNQEFTRSVNKEASDRQTAMEKLMEQTIEKEEIVVKDSEILVKQTENVQTDHTDDSTIVTESSSLNKVSAVQDNQESLATNAKPLNLSIHDGEIKKVESTFESSSQATQNMLEISASENNKLSPESSPQSEDNVSTIISTDELTVKITDETKPEAERVFDKMNNITDAENMYQWVLEEAEIIGLENALANLEKHKEAVGEASLQVTLAKACLLDRLSIINEIPSNVEEAIKALKVLIKHPNCSKESKIFAFGKLTEKTLRQGNYNEAIEHTKRIIELDPDDSYPQIELSIYYMYAGDVDKAREILESVIAKDPQNGLAMLHFGSLQMLEASQGRPITTTFDKVAEMLIFGLNNTDSNVHEARHYAQLYDALLRSGRESEALQLLQKGADENAILSPHQLCQSFMTGHSSKPFWEATEVAYDFAQVNQLIENFIQANIDKIDAIQMHPENAFFVQSGNADILELLIEGERLSSCDSNIEASTLCDIAEKVVGSCGFCDSYIMKMSGDTAFWKRSGLTNLGLRTVWILHKSDNAAVLNVDVGDQKKTLDKEKFTIFDNSYVNRLQSKSPNGQSIYWIFVVDSWHPNVDNETKESLQKES